MTSEEVLTGLALTNAYIADGNSGLSGDDAQSFTHWIAAAETLIESQQAEIERLRNPWVSVEDELPEDGSIVLTIEPGETFPRVNEYGPQSEWESEAKAYRPIGSTFAEWEEFPTHWMPIPIPALEWEPES